MAALTTGNIWQVRLVSQWTDQVAITTLHYIVGTTAGAPTDVHFVTALGALFPTAYKNCMCAAATYRGLQVQKVWPGPKTFPRIDITGAGAGTFDGTGNPLPGQVTGIVKKLTELAGPRYRGRVYVPWVDEDANDGTSATPTALYLGDLQDFADDVFTTVGVVSGGNTADMIPGVFHRDTTTITPLSACIASDRWGTQHSRGDFGQQNVPPF